VISDIDDTIKVSNVNDKKALLQNTFVRPYEAVEGMAALYTEWVRQGVVVHYLSASPWQLYPALSGFMRQAGFPPGPIEMKRFRVKSRTFLSLFKDPMSYKLPHLRDLLKRYRD
jgi:phosphatidate phosphatase APP1